MGEIKDGGPAFPTGLTGKVQLAGGRIDGAHVPEFDPKHAGMTLRDKFADSALKGLCANPGGPFQQCDQGGWRLVNCTIDNIADLCYGLADAMLRARNPNHE